MCIDRNLAYMDSWLSWWEIRIAHWGGIMTSIEKSADGPNTPRTNLAESKHGSWLAGEGFRRRISLYDACTTDLANSILQSSKTISYSIGKHIGKGPSIQRLTERHDSRPRHVIKGQSMRQSRGPHCTKNPPHLVVIERRHDGSASQLRWSAWMTMHRTDLSSTPLAKTVRNAADEGK